MFLSERWHGIAPLFTWWKEEEEAAEPRDAGGMCDEWKKVKIQIKGKREVEEEGWINK